MKKLILASVNALALLACSLVAHAQTYPSPTFQNTTVLGTLTANTLSFTNPIPVGSGGTGAATLTAHGVLLGQGTGAVTAVSPAAANFALLATGASSDPTFQQLTTSVVNYNQGNASAVTRTLLSRLQDTVSVMDFGCDKTGATDDSTCFSNAVAALPTSGGTIEIPAGVYLVNAFPSLASKVNITFRGAGGVTAGAVGATEIKIGLTGGGSFINAPGSAGLAFQDIQFVYSSSAFTGWIMSFGNNGSDAAFARIERCGFMSNSSSLFTASAINMDKTIVWSVKDSVFSGLSEAIQGYTAATADYSNVGTIARNQFSNTRFAPIAGGGQSWVVTNNNFEGFNNGTAGNALAGSLGMTSSVAMQGLQYTGNWHGDLNAAGGTWVTVFGGGIDINNNWFGGIAGSNAISANDVQGLRVTANSFTNFGTALSFDTAGNTDVQYESNQFSSVSNTVGNAQNYSGVSLIGGSFSATGAITTAGTPIVPTVSTISALKSLSTTAAAALGRVYVAGYYAATDAGGGYFTWNGSSSTADNGGTFIQPSSLPASGRWVRDGYLAGRYTPAMFGSQANGAADDAAPIRAAMLALSQLTGGGTLQLTCNTTYNLASTAGNTLRSLIYPYSNVNIVGCGPSSVLKVAAGMNISTGTGFYVIYPLDSSSSYPINNVQYREFKVDENGSNNSCSNSCYNNNIAIGAVYGDGILIDGVTVVNNPGSQDFSLGNPSATFPTIENVRIVNSRDENSCDLVNTACTDFSAIYLDVVNGVVVGNTFYNSSQSLKNTAIEVHGFDIAVTGNVVWNYNIGANIAGQNDNVTAITMTGNAFVNVYTGMRMWANSGKIASNIVFSNNSILMTSEVYGPAIDLDQDINSGSNAEEITISGNTLVSGQASGTTNIWGGIRLGQWVHQNITGNTFRGFSGPAVYVGSSLLNSSVVNISDNTITDVGSTSTTASKVAIQLNSATNAASINVHGNVIQSDSGYASTGIAGTAGAQVATAVYGNVMGGAGMTTQINMTGTNAKVGVTCSAGSPTASFTSYMGVQTHC
jgi:hypothetical protein